jgi:hypothetical protein
MPNRILERWNGLHNFFKKTFNIALMLLTCANGIFEGII